MRSSFSPADQTIDPDLWLHTKDQQIGTTVRRGVRGAKRNL